MNTDDMTAQDAGLAGTNPGRLFAGSCFALISTAVTFAVVAAIMGPLKEKFVLTNEQVGWIAGAATWGFTLSIFVLGPLCDALGMRLLMRFAFLCHFAGVLVMIFAEAISQRLGFTPFAALFAGALIISLGNGTVEAACNPLIATIYPTKKTQKLNQFHMWFPGGIVIGGLTCFALGKLGITDWRVELAVILVPTVIYGILFTAQKFPLTERVQSGVSFGGMVKETLLRPLFIVLFFCMMITASLELGPQRWIPSVLESGGIPGILVLVWITGLMAVMRYFAGPVVHKLSNTGVLLISAVLAGLGLVMLSFYGDNLAGAFIAATIFALGVCYFWPTMIGTVAERVPKGGALAMAILGGTGMAVVGLVTTPQMGAIADKYLHQQLQPAQTAIVLQQIATDYELMAVKAPSADRAKDFKGVASEASKTLAAYNTTKELPAQTAEALRLAIKTDGSTASAAEAVKLLGPADNYGGRMSFRYVAPLSLILIVVFGVMYLQDKKRGGYKAQPLTAKRTTDRQTVSQSK